jgi:DNA helicase II / ATP-dependent DNA helicase PcrA
MPFEESQAIQDYISASGRIFLNACPGSGKTTTVAYKLFHLVTNWEKNYSGYCGIACLSFTNIAKEEISQKYVEFSKAPLRFPHLVATIDSFINHYITLPFFYLFGSKVERPKIVEDSSFINEAWEHHGQRWEFRNKKKQPIDVSYRPSDIQVEPDGTFTWKGHKPNLEIVEEKTFLEYCKAIKSWQIREKGLLTMSDSAFIASYLLRKHPRIAGWLAERFPIIIVDESQDTSETQFAILEAIADAGLTSLEMIGDPYQCLYEWRDAQPGLLVEKTYNDPKWMVLPLNDNRRSQARITRCFSRLRAEHEPPIRSVVHLDVDNPILIVRYAEDHESEALDKYLSRCGKFQHNQVVVRGRTLRNKLLGGFDPENILSLWHSPIPLKIIEASRSFRALETKRAINLVRSVVPLVVEPDSDYSKRRELEEQFRNDDELNGTLFYLVRHLPQFNTTVKEWTDSTAKFLSDTLAARFSIPKALEFELKGGKYAHYHSKTIGDLYGDRAPAKVPVSTIHQVKGMTFDTLLLILSANSKGGNISIHDIKRAEGFPSEKQRMIYVAMSRPKYLLSIGVPNTTPEALIYEALGNDVEFI